MRLEKLAQFSSLILVFNLPRCTALCAAGEEDDESGWKLLDGALKQAVFHPEFQLQREHVFKANDVRETVNFETEPWRPRKELLKSYLWKNRNNMEQYP